jgi:hypothetical protein
MKVVILTPCRNGYVTAGFAESLAHLISYSLKERPELEIFPVFVQGSRLSLNRHELVRAAINNGAEWALWADDDHMFPANALVRMLSVNLPIVGVNFAMRRIPTTPTAGRARQGADGYDLVYTTKVQADAGDFEKVDRIGFGLTLISMEVFRKVPMPWFETSTEDTYFFKKAAEAGFPIHIDHWLSWNSSHLHLVPLTMQDALDARA